MASPFHEVYQPRTVSDLGIWTVGPIALKIYGLVATDQEIGEDTQAFARQFLEKDVLKRMEDMGESNGLGFLIIHPGQTGLTISAHWWTYGSVLCQHNFRQFHGSKEPLNTITRPVIGCVWELAIINSEQVSWRETMMTQTPNPSAYLDRRLPAAAV